MHRASPQCRSMRLWEWSALAERRVRQRLSPSGWRVRNPRFSRFYRSGVWLCVGRPSTYGLVGACSCRIHRCLFEQRRVVLLEAPSMLTPFSLQYRGLPADQRRVASRSQDSLRQVPPPQWLLAACEAYQEPRHSGSSSFSTCYASRSSRHRSLSRELGYAPTSVFHSLVELAIVSASPAMVAQANLSR